MGVRIGINPLTWTNDDMPELGGDTPLEVCLSEAREAGYSGIELGNKFPRDAAVLAPILKQFDLDLISGWYSARLRERTAREEIAAMDGHLTLLSEMGCDVMVFAEVSGCVHGNRGQPLSARPRMSGGEWPEFTGHLTAVAEHMASRGVRMAYHHHMGTVVETEDDIARLIDNTGDAVGLLLDSGHLTYAGGDPVGLTKTYGTRINHVHCKDVRLDILRHALKGDQSFMDAVLDGVFTVPGDGGIDFTSLCRALSDIAYVGWLVVEAEQDPKKAHPMTYAKLGHAGVAAAIAASGLGWQSEIPA